MAQRKKLSEILSGMSGFTMVLGTTEHLDGGRRVEVRQAIPMTWGSRNGTTVVYDEEGRPWIKSEIWTGPGMTVDEYKLRGGAYVPHCSDGGHFIREVLPTL